MDNRWPIFHNPIITLIVDTHTSLSPKIIWTWFSLHDALFSSFTKNLPKYKGKQKKEGRKERGLDSEVLDRIIGEGAPLLLLFLFIISYLFVCFRVSSRDRGEKGVVSQSVQYWCQCFRLLCRRVHSLPPLHCMYSPPPPPLLHLTTLPSSHVLFYPIFIHPSTYDHPMTDWLSDWLTKWLTDWLHLFIHSFIRLVSETVSPVQLRERESVGGEWGSLFAPMSSKQTPSWTYLVMLSCCWVIASTWQDGHAGIRPLPRGFRTWVPATRNSL